MAKLLYYDMLHWAEFLKKVFNLGWYSGKLEINLKIEGEFEGFSGRASETWEYRMIIEIKPNKDLNLPLMIFVQRDHEYPSNFFERVYTDFTAQLSKPNENVETVQPPGV